MAGHEWSCLNATVLNVTNIIDFWVTNRVCVCARACVCVLRWDEGHRKKKKEEGQNDRLGIVKWDGACWDRG